MEKNRSMVQKESTWPHCAEFIITAGHRMYAAPTKRAVCSFVSLRATYMRATAQTKSESMGGSAYNVSSSPCHCQNCIPNSACTPDTTLSISQSTYRYPGG